MIEQVYPFLWIKDNDIEAIKKEILAIKKSGMNAFCVESRIHPDFCGIQWWNIMDEILAYAKLMEMKVWLLDDKSYPTGSAGGKIVDDSPLRPWRIKIDNVDLEGRKGNIRLLLRTQEDFLQEGEILGVFLLEIKENVVKNIQDLTENVSGDVVQFEYDGNPARLAVVMKTRGGWEREERKNYIDMLNPNSVNQLIETVYEPHYERYIKSGTYVGVFEGFFSDEPRFANGFSFQEFSLGIHDCARTIGMLGMAYPWREQLWEQVELYAHENRGFERKDMLALWYDIGENTSLIRCAYMNVITKEYANNFSKCLATWCHKRGLVYGGHIIEDGGAHRRLSCSPGHYFRSQEGADYSSVDVVLHQIKPYYENMHIAPLSGGYADPVFYNYSLAKLAVSAALLDVEKEGRALCEIFGAYGWGESIEEMLFLTNHMLVRGINMFIPHAFTSEFPNTDCPPHFHCGGNNSAFEGFCVLGKYMVEMCKRFSGGQAYTPVAVLYDAEGEWSGRAFADMDKVAKCLMEHQVNFLFIPEYKLEEYQDYECLIVPYREYLSPQTKSILDKIKRTKKVHILSSNTQSEIDKIIEGIKEAGLTTLKIYGNSKALRVMRYDKHGETVYLLHNEAPDLIEFQIETEGQDVHVEDVLNERTTVLPQIEGRVTIEMKAGQMLIIRKIQHQNLVLCRDKKVENVSFQLLKESRDEKQYSVKIERKQGQELIVHYEGEFLQVRIDDTQLYRISHPARIILPNNKCTDILLTIRNNLAEVMKDDLSKFSILRPVELTKVSICEEQLYDDD